MMTRTRRGAEEEGGELVKAMIRNVLGLIEFSMMMTRPASGTHNPAMSVISLKRYAWLSIGAAVTTLLFSIGKWLIGQYIGRTGVASAFGAAGSVVVLMVWVYYSAQIMLFGAEISSVYAHRHGSLAGRTAPPAR